MAYCSIHTFSELLPNGICLECERAMDKQIMPTMNEQLTTTLEPDICIISNCGKPRKWKGLCSKCYGEAKQLIDAQQTTWEELNTMGLCTIPATPFETAFKEAKFKKAHTLPSSIQK